MTIHDNALDHLVDEVHGDLDLDPSSLDRIRRSLPDSATAAAAGAPPVALSPDPESTDDRTVWREDRRQGATVLVLAAAVATMFVVLLAATVRPGGAVSPAAAALADDLGYQAAVEAYPQLGPEEWLSAGPEQRSALADGELTQAEYEEGFHRYRACVNAGGYDFRFVERRGPFFNFAIPGEAVDIGPNDACYDQEWRVQDQLWQALHEEQTEQVLRTRYCLRQAGLDIGESAEETYNRFEESGLSWDRCAEQFAASGQAWTVYTGE